MAPIGDPVREWEIMAPSDIPAPIEVPVPVEQPVEVEVEA